MGGARWSELLKIWERLLRRRLKDRSTIGDQPTRRTQVRGDFCVTLQRLHGTLKCLRHHIVRRPEWKQAHSVEAVSAHIDVTAEHVPFAHKQPMKPLHFLHLVRWCGCENRHAHIQSKRGANPLMPDFASHAPVSKKFPSGIEHIQTVLMCQYVDMQIRQSRVVAIRPGLPSINLYCLW